MSWLENGAIICPVSGFVSLSRPGSPSHFTLFNGNMPDGFLAYLLSSGRLDGPGNVWKKVRNKKPDKLLVQAVWR